MSRSLRRARRSTTIDTGPSMSAPTCAIASPGSVVVNDSTDYFESAQPFGGAAGTRTGWGRVGGLQQLRDMTDVRCTIISLDEE